MLSHQSLGHDQSFHRTKNLHVRCVVPDNIPTPSTDFFRFEPPHPLQLSLQAREPSHPHWGWVWNHGSGTMLSRIIHLTILNSVCHEGITKSPTGAEKKIITVMILLSTVPVSTSPSRSLSYALTTAHQRTLG